MAPVDDWGKDPSVRNMRRIFKEIEEEQNRLLVHLDISPYDPRIRAWRERTLEIFEKVWTAMTHRGMIVDEKRASALYVHCLARVMASEGEEVPDGLLPMKEEGERILEEVLV